MKCEICGNNDFILTNSETYEVEYVLRENENGEMDLVSESNIGFVEYQHESFRCKKCNHELYVR